jgi:hypothetical protein
MQLNRDLDIYQGDDFFHTVNIFGEDGEPMAFASEDEFSAQIREAGETSLSPAGPLLATFVCTKQGGGIVTLSLSSSVAATIPPGRHWYELRMITPQPGSTPDYVLTLFSGLAVVHPEITKEPIVL